MSLVLRRFVSIRGSSWKKFVRVERTFFSSTPAVRGFSAVPSCGDRLRGPSTVAGTGFPSRSLVSSPSSPSSTPASSPSMAVPPDQADTSVHLRWADLTPERIHEMKDAAMKQATEITDAITAVPLGEVSYEGIIEGLEKRDRVTDIQGSNIDFPSNVHSDKAIRDASTEAEKALSDFSVELRCNKDVFDRVVAYKEKAYDSLDAQGKRFVDFVIRDGRRIGLHLSEEVRSQVKEVDMQLSKFSIDFSRNLAEEATKLPFTLEELEGMPDDFIKSLEKNEDGKLQVTLKYPHTVPVANLARNAETRRKVNVAFNSRCKEANTKIIEEMLELRKKKAALLSYPNFADYVLETRMAGNSGDVQSFLTSLSQRITPLSKQEMAKLLQYKQEECEKLGRPFDGMINAWDVSYYKTQVEEKEYSIDQNAYKVYFPLEKVTTGLLEIYQELLGVTFTQVENADVWHPDVTMYRVTEKTNGWILGFFYLDLHPREGKYGHAAVFPLQSSTRLPDNKRQVAVCAMVANFTKPTADKPSLLQHTEVVTYFHEFGHVMHHICSLRTQYTRFSGTRVERDFVEAPSQMLENWCWQCEPLQRMSGHYETGEALPAEMIEKLVASRNANVGIFTKRQLCFGLFDQYIHTCAGKVDTQSVYNQFCLDINGYPAAEGTNMPATFAHIAAGYEAQYYGYMWSDVFSYDMFFSRFHKEGVMNTDIGQQYRDRVLAPGGSRDAKELLRDFLGRDPNQDAFLEQKGLASL